MSRRSERERTLAWVLFVNTGRKLGIHAQTLGMALGRDAQTDARGATQVLDRGAEAVARDTVPCASQVLDRGAEAVARGAARCALHVLDRGAQAGAQAVARGSVPCASQVLDRGAETVSRGAALPAMYLRRAESLAVAPVARA